MNLTIDVKNYLLEQSGRFPMPDWEALGDQLDACYENEEEHLVWSAISLQWVQTLHASCPEGYQIHESERFVLLGELRERKAAEVLEFLERCFQRIQRLLGEVASTSYIGKCPVLVFSDQQLFYEYLAQYDDGEETESGGVGGVYLNRGYGHFAIPSVDMREYIAVMSHELCHALLGHLPLPVWLNEAITCEVEDAVAASSYYHLDREIIERHQAYWNEDRIQAFWKGDSFWAADEGQELSYHLCRFILNGLRGGGAIPDEDIRAFILKASYEDAGHAAAKSVLGVKLGDSLCGLLGDGNWNPILPIDFERLSKDLQTS